jgi:hypothetical protein
MMFVLNKQNNEDSRKAEAYSKHIGNLKKKKPFSARLNNLLGLYTTMYRSARPITQDDFVFFLFSPFPFLTSFPSTSTFILHIFSFMFPFLF